MVDKTLRLAVCFACLAGAERVFAQSATFDRGTQSSFNIVQGESFQLPVHLMFDTPSIGAGFYLNESTSAGFSITGVNRAASPFTDFVTTDSQITSTTSGNNVLNPRNDRNLGGLTSDLSTIAAGMYDLGSFTLSSSGVAPGTYTIGIGPSSDLEVLDGSFGNFPNIGTQSVSVTVSPVPEPGTIVGLTSGGVCLLVGAWWFRWRRKLLLLAAKVGVRENEDPRHSPDDSRYPPRSTRRRLRRADD